jgi:hypothetical protein
MKIEIGKFNNLKVMRLVAIGAYLDDGKNGILLPKKYCTLDLEVGSELAVFIYHDNEGRWIATTEKPLATVGEVAYMRITDLTEHGAFLDNGIAKDVFLHCTNMVSDSIIGEYVWVYLYLDRDRITASERLDDFIGNDNLSVIEKQEVELMAYRKTEIGYVMMINKMHLGILHFNEIFQPIQLGKLYTGFVKRIIGNVQPPKIDVSLGKIGYAKVENESEKIIRLLQENKNYLPYLDKSSPENIYDFFNMSKKTFKMTIGKLYKDRIINIEDNGIRLLEED